jgi:hypothetical protein
MYRKLTITRREALKLTGIAAGALYSLKLPAFAAIPEAFIGKEVFERIMQDAAAWKRLPIGELVGKIARDLEGIPYKSGTLELSYDSEICSVDLTGLDCVTFFETTLNVARMLKHGGKTPADLLKEVQFTRYRGGVKGDYSSRLHYTSDWLYDNEKKGTVRILGDLPGAEDYKPNVHFMSEHPQSYPQLAAHPELIAKIKKFETLINSRTLRFIPIEKIAGVESSLKTGDIVGVCTSTPGLDITHTGIIVCDENESPRFMHASSNKTNYKVTIKPGPISTALAWTKTNTGAVFARPL